MNLSNSLKLILKYNVFSESEREALGMSNVEESDEILGSIYSVLAHEVRRDLLRIVGGYRKPIPFSEIIEYLDVRPGTFYFHIKKMKGFIDQTEDREYILTKQGILALKFLESGEIQITKPLEVDDQIQIVQKQEGFLSRILLSDFFREVTLTKRTLVEIGFIVLLLIFLTEAAHLGVIPLFYTPVLYFGPIASIVLILFEILLLWLILEITTSLFDHKRLPNREEFSIELLLAVPLCLLPLGIFPGLVFLSNLIGFPMLEVLPVAAILLQLILQLISGLLLAQATSTCKPVTLEKALIPVLILIYLSASTSFLLGLLTST